MRPLSDPYIRSILHDEEIYPEPMAFRPERFLCEDGSLNPGIQDPDVAMFGYGRRYVQQDNCAPLTSLMINADISLII